MYTCTCNKGIYKRTHSCHICFLGGIVVALENENIPLSVCMYNSNVTITSIKEENPGIKEAKEIQVYQVHADCTVHMQSIIAKNKLV